MTRRGIFGAAVIAAVLVVGEASAAEPPLFLPGDRTTSRLPGEMSRSSDDHSDGVYGRFAGLFDLGLQGGAELREGGTAGAAIVSLHYLFMAGIYAEYTDALGGATVDSTRIASFGVDVRPAFIPRWSNGGEEGPGVVDLALDSISLALGAYFREPRDQAFGDRRGLELSMGFGVPLAGWADGPWVSARGILRWDDPGEKSREAARTAALLSLGWHFTFGR